MRRPFPLTLVLFVAMSLAGVARAGDTPLSPPSSTVVIKPVTVPLLRIGGLPAVNAVVNGSKAYPFVIDTAADVFAISPQRAQAWNLPAIGKDEMGNPTMRVRELSVGDAHFRGLLAAADPFLNGHDEAGVLGANVFRNVLLSIDFARNTVTFASGRLPPANGVDILAYKPSKGGAPTIQISVCGLKIAVGIDSAAPAVLRLPKSMMSDLRCDHHVVGSDETIGAQAGPSRVTDARLDGDLHFADIRLRHPVVRFGAGPALFLGSGALAGVVLTLDQENRLLRLQSI
jgi:hypothetical protein